MLALLARLTLGAVLLVAGVTKLRDRTGTAQSIREFGIHRRLIQPLTYTVSLAELAAATLLLATPSSAWWGGLLGSLLLIGFTIGIATNLLHGRRPVCGCFGELSTRPIGRGTLARNAALLGVAALVLWQTAPAPIAAWLPPKDVSALSGVRALDAVFVFTLAGQSWLMLQLMRQNGRLLIRVEQLEAAGTPGSATLARLAPPRLAPGAPAPPFALADQLGARHTLEGLRAQGRTVLLFFTDPACAICVALLPNVAYWQTTYNDVLTIALVSRGTSTLMRTKLGGLTLQHVLSISDDALLQAYGVQGTPAAVLIDPDGTLASAVVGGPGGVRRLVRAALAARRPDGPLLGAGEPTPLRHLITTSEDEIDLHQRPSLVLFWDAQCTYCQAVLDSLAVGNGVALRRRMQLVIITDEPEAVTLPCAIVHDADRTIAGLFGIQGAPAAVVVGPGGRTAHPPALGAQAVRSLLTELTEPVDAAL